MRFWPFRRARPALRTSPDDVLVTEELLHSAVADVFAVRDRQVFGGVIAYRGHLLVAPADAVDRLVARFRPFGFTPFLRAGEGAVILQALPLTEPVVRPRIGINIALFVMTCFTTLVSGAFLFASPTFTPLGNSGLIAALLTGAPFAFTLLSILGVHEFGHYFTARYYKAAVSLPYFIPAPPIVLFGTLGAIIRLRSPARDRNSLFDIAAAGPLAGLAIAIPALYVGLQWSVLGKIPSGDVMQFGDPLLLFVVGFHPTPPLDDVTPLTTGRRVLGWVCLILLVLLIPPVPIAFS